MCFAYGGPHARVSSPRVGCSIFITSALFQLHRQHRISRSRGRLRDLSILDSTMPTRGLPVFACNTALDRQPNRKYFSYAAHTPARTLVMSKTRTPANGRVGESVAAVARPLQRGYLMSLSLMRVPKSLMRPPDVLIEAIVY